MAQYEVTLRDYWRILRRRKGVVLFTGCLLAALSFAIASVWQPPSQFRATAKVQITSAQAVASLYLQNLSYNAPDQIETQRAIVTSYPVLRRTGEELGLFGSAATAEDTARAVLALQARIVARQEGYTNIVAIDATDAEPARARDLANAISRVYQAYNHELKNQQAVKHRQFVEGQREAARFVLEQAEEEVKQYRENNDLVSLESQASVILQQITASEQGVETLEGNLGAIAAMESEIASRRGLSEESIRGASPTVVGESFVRLSQQLQGLRLERQGLLVQFTEGHPRVQEVQAKIEALQRSLGDELRQRRQELLRQLGNARATLDRARVSYGQLPARGLELARLQREVSMRQQVVTALEEQYQTALIREADKLEEVTPLQWAVTPTEPINPHHPLKRAGLGLLLGVILGLVFAVIAESLDTSIGTIEDVQEYAGAQVVGVIPYIDVDEVRDSLRRRGRRVDDERSLQRQAQLVAYFDPQSTLAESYRTLRTNIEFATVEKGSKALMVTSSMLREGKSTTIANLAMTMAQMGKRTLLMDCDLRKPSIARLFGLEREPGLTEVIVGNYQWRDVLRTVTDIVTGGIGMEDVLQTQGISNLHILTSGAIPPNPAELLNSRRMADFLAEAREAYDVVLIDAPPVLQVTDAAILGKRVDGVLMVYKAGDIPRTSLKRSTTLLRSMQVELLGVVINGISANLSSDYQDLGYHSYYAYGAEPDRERRGWTAWLPGRVRRWGGRPPADLEEDSGEGETTGRPRVADAEPAGQRTAAVVSYALLAVVGAGLVWQSGYLARPLGLAPLLTVRTAVAPEDASATAPSTAPAAGGPADPATTAAPAPVVATPETAMAPLAPDRPSSGRDTAPADAAAPPAAKPLPAAAPQAVPVPGTAPASASPSAPTSPGTPASSAALARAAPEAGREGPGQPYVLRVAAYRPGSGWVGRTLRRLRGAGENAFAVPAVVAGQRLERLMIGGFATGADAEAHGRQLRQGKILEEYAVMRLAWTVELGRFPDRDRAAAALAGLPDGGPTAYLQAAADGGYRLLAGAFASEVEARAYVAATGSGLGSAQVVSR